MHWADGRNHTIRIPHGKPSEFTEAVSPTLPACPAIV